MYIYSKSHILGNNMTMNHSEIQNYNAFRFNQACLNNIQDICSPLLNNLNLTHFGFLRYKADGSYLAISNDIAWAKTHLSQDYASSPYFLQELCSLPTNSYYASLWPVVHSYDATLEALFEHNIWHGLNIVQTHSDATDVYYFASSRENYQVTSLYLNNPDLIKRFITFFNCQTKNIFDKATKNEYAYSENYKNIVQQKNVEGLHHNIYPHKNDIDAFIKETEIKKFETTESQSFSLREVQCMYLLSKGRTMKEIAKHLSLSPRTVETYINNVKNKIKCTSKSEIISFYEQSNFKDIIS